MNVLLYLAEAFIVAYLSRLVSNRLRLPSVSGYVIGGVILGGSFLFWHPGGKSFSEQWLFTSEVLTEMEVVTQIALGIIALSIGAELEFKVLRKLGKSVLYITLLGAFVPFIVVAAFVALVWDNIPLALLLGAVASATAPAATVAVLQQYRAKGPLTSTIMAVVGLDDGVSFIIFAFAMTIVKGMIGGESLSIVHGLLLPVSEIATSLAIGALFGFVAARLLVTSRDQETTIFILGALILLVSGIATIFHASRLLANMAAGAIIVNINPLLKKKMRLSFSSFTPIFYALFFILGGAHLDISGVAGIWKIGLAYFFCRVFGKIAGASLGAWWGKALPRVRKWVGISLLPQAGVAVALVLAIEHEFGGGGYGEAGISLASNAFNVVIVTTFFAEFFGPYFTKLAIVKAGEANE